MYIYATGCGSITGSDYLTLPHLPYLTYLHLTYISHGAVLNTTNTLTYTRSIVIYPLLCYQPLCCPSPPLLPVTNHNRRNGYALTIKQSIPKPQQVYYCCDRGSYQPRRSKPLMPIPDHHRKRLRSLRQTGCEYTVFIRYSKKQKAWIVSESKNHNHAATEDSDEHPVHRGLQPTENQQLSELATGDCLLSVPQILRIHIAYPFLKIFAMPYKYRSTTSSWANQCRGCGGEAIRLVGGTPSRRIKTDALRIWCMLPLKDYGYFRGFQL